ncbi:hypothetical protein BJD20_03305 [Acinetobacter proteolyticus]|jgi:hypothetical protein|uniref:DUF1543 domain-containing protein n=1 Tax=Acinetobacter proteolyticus TaxID=1776741 RepID=A0A653KBX7_9GAMM|nr:DUF1543 domain-containing protein [Acinetobacter proteolyticus]OEY94256.1 hypothetical protein BJD20_03305 [Acinetobacter proteolyticus]VXA57563.1 conserved hypothetical protein [Acinetobacter proteolyticus]
MPSLFMVMLGGRHAKANTEVHDVVMALGESLSEVIPQLKQAWFGESKGLHIDAWAQISGVQSQGVNYQIQFSDAAPSVLDEKLYLINLGGYSLNAFGELHSYHLVVASDAVIAKQLGKQFIEQDWHKPHTDRVVDVDDCIPIDHVAGRYIHLVQDEFKPTVWENTYLTLD